MLRPNGPREAVVLGAEELDDEPLDAREHAVHAEQPAFGVLVIANPPEDART